MVTTVRLTDLEYEELRIASHFYREAMKWRIKFSNRKWATENFRDLENRPLKQSVDRFFEQVQAFEEATGQYVRRIASQHPAWGWASQVRGIGIDTFGWLMGFLGVLPPRPDKGVSAWWKVCGLYSDPRLQEERNGEVRHRMPTFAALKAAVNAKRLSKEEAKASFVPGARMACYVIADNLVRQRGFYYQFYLDQKERLLRREKIEKWRAHKIARWIMMKLFLSHLYEVWAKEEGITVPEPYLFAAQPGSPHTKIDPWAVIEWERKFAPKRGGRGRSREDDE